MGVGSVQGLFLATKFIGVFGVRCDELGRLNPEVALENWQTEAFLGHPRHKLQNPNLNP